MDRLSNPISSVAVDTTVAACDEISFGPYAGGMVFIPAGSAVTLLTWYAADKRGGTYLPAYDEDGIAVTQTVAEGGAYTLPSALFGAPALKALSNAAGTVAISMKA